MGFVAAAVSMIGGWLTGGSIMATLAVNLMASTAVSALTAALNKPKARQPGIKSEYTTEGGTVAQSFMLGWYATNGHMVCPPMSHGKAGKTPNAYLTYVISLGNVPGQQIDKLIVDDTEVEFETYEETMPIGGVVPFGRPLWWYLGQGLDPLNPNASLPKITPGRPGKGKYAGKIWLRYYDGTQTTADSYLQAIAGPGTAWDEGSKRPWGADMVGVDTCYAVITFRFWRNVFPGLPRCRFVMSGVPLYDPRKDSSVGGDGPQRWITPSTWAPSNNALVQAYNVLRGIPINGGPLWGYGVEGEDLPLSAWIPAMNTADLDEGGSPRWQSGLEVSVDEEPADILDEIGKVSCTAFAEVGGVWKPRVGPPAAPVYFFTDDDILLNHEATATPFPSIDDTYNGVHASYPDPDQLWQPKDAPPRYNADWEASDNSRRRVADLSLAACPYPEQVQRVMRGYIEEERRFRRHVLTLPPEASMLEPLDAVSWSSAEHGYVGKIFEVVEPIVHPDTLAVTVSLRERDSTDYAWQPNFVLPSTPASVLVPNTPPVVPTSFTAEGIALNDTQGRPRCAAARLRWGGWALDGITSVAWEIRQAGQDDTSRGLMGDPEAGEIIVTSGVLPSAQYEARISFNSDGRDVAWTSWAAFTTPAIRIPVDDLDTTPPARPAAVTLSSTPGELIASWAADAADVIYSELEITEAGGNAVLFQTSGTRYRWAPVFSGVSYTVRRRAVDRLGNKSAWSNPATHVVAADTIPPATPTGLVLTAGVKSIWLRWNANTEADLSHYEIRQENATFTPNAATPPTYSSTANNFLVPDVGYATRRWFAVRAVDTSGNKSAWSTVANATTEAKQAITASDIQGIVTATAFATGIEPVTIHTGTALPTAKGTSTLLWNGKLYRWDGTAYVSTVPAEDIAGQVTAAQIAGLEASKITGQLTDAQIAAVGAAKLTGQIKGPQIESAAITASKFANGLVPVEILDALPATGNFAGRTVFLTTNGKLYRHAGSPINASGFTASVASADISGQIADAQLAAIAASKVSGQLTDAQIAQVSAAKLAGQVASGQIADGAISASKIVNGAVGALKLADNAVTTTKIANGAIAEGKLADGAATAAKIATGAITATKIEDGAISTPKLAAGAVTAGKIEAGAVTAGKIAAGAVTATEIATGAITAGKVAAKAIGASQIAAGSIVASKMALIDTTNLIVDSDVQDIAYWVLGQSSIALNPTYGDDNAWAGSKGAIIVDSAPNNPAAASNIHSQWIPANEGEQFFASAKIAATATHESQVIIQFADKSTANLGIRASPVKTSTAAEIVSVSAAAPINTRYVRLILGVRPNSYPATGNVAFTSPIMRRKAAAELIVDGAVTATKIAAEAISATHISSGAVTADKVSANAVTADKIASNAVTAAKIEAGAVETAKLAAGAVVADKITSGAVIADKLAANAVTADKIEANAVTTAKIAAGAVIADKVAAGAVVADKIAADAVEASKIKAGAVEAVKIAAGAVETAKLAAGAVIADKIASNAVTAVKIQAGAVETAKLAAGAVIADKIAADAVVTDKIAANAVTAAKIEADAVIAGKIAAGAINTRELAAGAITASVIGVGDFTNLVPDDQLQDPAAWSGSGTLQPGGAPAWAGSPGSIRFDPGASQQAKTSLPFSVTPGEEFWATFQAIFAGTATVMDLRCYVYFYDKAGALLPNVSAFIAGATSRSQFIYENAVPVVVPSGAFTGRFVGVYGATNNGWGALMSPTIRRRNGGKLIVDGAIKGNHLTVNEAVITGPAQIAQLIVESGHIVDLIAGKIRGGTALLGTVTVNGTALGTSTDRAADPAGRINAHTTKIDPGKIVISGSTTLADWRSGGDQTKIHGGNLDTNSVRANALEIGSRNVTIENISFEHNAPGANQVSWTAGTIRYPGDDGVQVGYSIPAGQASWTAGVLYLVYTKGGSVIWSTTDAAVAFNPNVLILATYQGGFRLNASHGRTIIDGNGVKTDALLVTGSSQLGTAIVKSLHIGNNELYIPRFYTRGDVLLSDSTSYSAPVVLFNQNIPDFNGGGYIIAFNGTVDSNVNYDSFGRFRLMVDDTTVAISSAGVRTSGANTGGFIPVSLIASATGAAGTNIQVHAWAHSAGDLTGSNSGDVAVNARSLTLTVSGARR